MSIMEWQKEVDGWINLHGVRYFNILTNTILLMEEVGEVARLIGRIDGEQSFKNPLTEEEQLKKLSEELGDVVFVLTCIANQKGIDLQKVLKDNILKKTKRDEQRHKNNPKLKDSSS